MVVFLALVKKEVFSCQGWLARHVGMLDEVDLGDVRRQRFESNRAEKAATRIVRRLLLSRLTSIHPAAWAFQLSANGKPSVRLPSLDREIWFSCFNTKELVGCAATFGSTVGVDAEQLDRFEDNRLFESMLCDTQLQASMARWDSTRRRKELACRWVTQEAQVKATGEGLRFLGLQEPRSVWPPITPLSDRAFSEIRAIDLWFAYVHEISAGTMLAIVTPHAVKSIEIEWIE